MISIGAGISSAAPKELASATGSTVTDQMDALRSKAGQLLLKEPILGEAVISQLKGLARTAKNSTATLLRAEEKQIHVSDGLETWLEEVNAAILKVDYVLDECKYYVHYQESGGSGQKDKLRSYLASRNSTRSKPSLINGLKSINSMLERTLKKGAHEISPEQPQGAPGGRSAAAQAMKDTWKLESEVVDDGVQTIVDKLLNQDNGSDLSVITLVGWGETGKMALAQLLYKNLDVMCYFDERMWVKLPSDLDNDMIAKRMLANLSRIGVGENVSLEKRLKGKRFLLVLVGASDINSTEFLLLKEFLEGLGGFRGSKVLIIAGKKAKIESSLEYKMNLGTIQYCLAVFEKIAFAEGGPIRTPKMEEYGRSMVNLCASNSLYIKLVGGLMYRLKEETQWSSIYNEKLVKMQGSGEIPRLCHDYMTSIPLKRCFQYCFFFPKGCLIRREEVIELWMAQGYLNVQSGDKSGQDMEALGRMYYDVLMKSSFFQVSEEDDFNMQSCKIPEVLHGLDFFKGKDCFRTIVKGDAKDCTGAEHLTLIDCKVKSSNSLKDKFSKLRSLRLENTEKLVDFLGYARGLHALIVVDKSLVELPDSIGKLIRLKYLDISRTSIVRLPDSISELYNLQTLRLHDLQDLPKNFDKLVVSMMHLYIHKLEDLYEMYELLSKCGELVYLSSSKASLKVFMNKEGKIDRTILHKLSNRCTTISIHCLENASKAGKGVNAWLSEIPATEILKLNWSAKRENSIDEDVLDKLKPSQSLKELTLENFKGTRFPSWMMNIGSVSNLVRMELENCSWCEKLPPFGDLSCLRILNIVGMNNVKSIAPDFYGTNPLQIFPKLKEFTLCGMLKLEDWSNSTASSTSAFPYLERFEVDQCPKLKCIPDVLLDGEHRCLREFKVSLCEKLTHLPKGLGKVDCVEVMELFGLPDLDNFILPERGSSLKTLVIGCFSDKIEQKELSKQLENLSSLKKMTFWGYGQNNIPDCFGRLSSLEVLKFESCRLLNSLPQIMSLKELHICYCPLLEDNCISGSRPEWSKVSHIETIVVNNEKIREPQTEEMP